MHSLFFILIASWSFLVYSVSREEYYNALKDIDFNLVKNDIVASLTDSQDFWPADFGNYGPLLIRLAWHCSGSYRDSDGRGGCDGARIRFEPELSWEDNTNLDKARRILGPIKDKYGLGLSWGDLIIYAGTVAIESMEGPVLGFCAGRFDDVNGNESINLGPTPEQEELFPCPIQGSCQSPLGASTVGLIYVNPEGPQGVPNPAASAIDVREVFSRMGMNDRETVALVGGGHAFGKTHGPCPLGAGPPPREQPQNPWPGNCGTGVGADAFTSGFEITWTPTPTRWSNLFFTGLLSNDWEVHGGPGGHNQWRIVDSDRNPQLGMLTSDISLLNDPSYLNLVNEYADNLGTLSNDFSRAWYKLVTRDMGPIHRCRGPLVPAAQPFQYPLPSPPQTDDLPDFDDVRDSIKNVMADNSSYGPKFVHLAYQCFSTYRKTDYLGGCDGARIRFTPQSNYPENNGLDAVLRILQPIQDDYDNLSWADLIVIAGNTALEDQNDRSFSFCPRRTDASNGDGSSTLQPNGDATASVKEMKALADRMDLSLSDFIVLKARLRSPDLQASQGYFGTYTNDPTVLSNEYFKVLLSETWVSQSGDSENIQFKAQGKDLYMTPSDVNMLSSNEFKTIIERFADDDEVFMDAFEDAWTKIMAIERGECEFEDGRSPPTGNSSNHLLSATFTLLLSYCLLFLNLF